MTEVIENQENRPQILTQSVYPLAFPKGVKLTCELCQKPAHNCCGKCLVTYYCDNDHQETDWYGIHEKICQSLKVLRKQQPFLPSEEQRKKREAEMNEKKLQLIDYTRSIAQRFLFEGAHQKAIPGAMTSLKMAIEMFGLKSVDLVPSYLILAEASQGLGSLSQAQEYLSQAEWTVLKNPDCPLEIVAKLNRNMAMLQMAQEQYDSALRFLANDIYCASEEFGTESFRVSGGYFLMANIYFKLGKMDIADSLYRQVVSMWHGHLRQTVMKKTEISELDSILGKIDDDDMEKETIELASEAEARKVLYSIYEIRKNETHPDSIEINRIEYCLCLIHFLAKEYDLVNNFNQTLMSKPDIDQEIKNDLNRVNTFIELKKKN